MRTISCLIAVLISVGSIYAEPPIDSRTAKIDNVQIFHAGTKRAKETIVTAGGRVLAVTGLGETITEARTRAYAAVSRIHFEGCHYRRDIALTAVNG